MIHPLAVLKVVQTAAVVRHLVRHALPLGVAAGAGQPLPLLLHQLLGQQDGILDARDGADTPEKEAGAAHQAGVHLHRPGLGKVGTRR